LSAAILPPRSHPSVHHRELALLTPDDYGVIVHSNKLLNFFTDFGLEAA